MSSNTPVSKVAMTRRGKRDHSKKNTKLLSSNGAHYPTHCNQQSNELAWRVLRAHSDEPKKPHRNGVRNLARGTGQHHGLFLEEKRHCPNHRTLAEAGTAKQMGRRWSSLSHHRTVFVVHPQAPTGLPSLPSRAAGIRRLWSSSNKKTHCFGGEIVGRD